MFNKVLHKILDKIQTETFISVTQKYVMNYKYPEIETVLQITISNCYTSFLIKTVMRTEKIS